MDSQQVKTSAAAQLPPIQQVLVVGAGWVGRQIVGQFTAHGIDVWWLDRSPEALRSGLDWLQSPSTFETISGYWPEGGWDGIPQRVHGITSLDSAPNAIDLVLETVTEQVSVKRRVFQETSRRYASPTVIASNSSYMTPSILDRFVESPERYAHLHFHVPVWRTQFVDIASSPRTNEETISRLVCFAERIGQHPLVERVENPGYVFNWMLRSLMQSALQLHAKQVANPEEIDLAWKQVTGMELGPFGIMDQIGLDLIHQSMSSARFIDGDEVWQPLIDQLQPLIDANKLGVKSGEGFYRYREQD